MKHLHIRKTANKGFIAKHIMADRAGAPPSDGQDPEREYSLPDMNALVDHVRQHMGDEQDVGDEE